MRYCIIGSGGREHTISWRLLSDGSASEVFVIPGNGGINSNCRVDLKINDFDAISRFCIEKKIDMVVVGPEAPLVSGIVDYLGQQKIPVFGPTRNAAMLEGSKIFAKQIMNKYGVPTASYNEFTNKRDLIKHIENIRNYPIVIKLDGLAAGKGVGIPENKDQALEFINSMVQDNSRVFVEDYIAGEEASVLGISDGETVLPMVTAQDHKRIFDGDKGPNTGGMGAYAPAPVMDRVKMKKVYDLVLKPTIEGMKKEGMPFKGILYAGLIINGGDIKVLEFNARFGDPETQVILPLLENRLGDLFEGSVTGTLNKLKMSFKEKYALSVVMASGGYPGNYEKGRLISGLEKTGDNALVFHAGTECVDGKYYTNGGRVLNVTALGTTLKEASEKAYHAVDRIHFEGASFRRDIGHRAFKYFK